MISNYLNEDVYSGYGWITVDYLVDSLDYEYNIQADFNEVMSILTTDLGYIIDVIDFCIYFGISDCIRNDFNAVHLLRML